MEFQPMVGMVDTPHEVYLFTGADHVGEPSDLVEAGTVGWVPLTQVPDLIDRGEVIGAASITGLLRHLLTRASAAAR